MVETIGTQLRHARTARGLSLDDAAHATKVRPARLADLENDVYTNFPNIAYARGFLAIYGRFLGVNVSPYLGAFEDTNSFGLDDYQYLRNEPVAEFRAPRREEKPARRRLLRPYRRRESDAAQVRRRRVPLILGGLALAFGIVGVSVWYLTLRFQQLGSLEQLAARHAARHHPAAATDPSSPAPAPTPDGTPSPVLSTWPLAEPPAAPGTDPVTIPGAEPGLTAVLDGVSPLLAFTLPPVAVANDPNGLPSLAAAPKPTPTPAPASKEIVVRPLKRTFVKVVVNDPASRPAYEDWLGPNTRPLSFRGDRVFVHVLDKGSVEISKNGVIQPAAGTDIKIE